MLSKAAFVLFVLLSFAASLRAQPLTPEAQIEDESLANPIPTTETQIEDEWPVNSIPTLCPPGTFARRDGSCVQCTRGTFQDEPGQTECKLCPENTISSSDGATSCVNCSAVLTTANALQTECVCQTQAILHSDTNECVLCPPGAAVHAGSCRRCTIGFYQPLAGQEECLRCPGNSYPESNATSCFECPPGQARIAPFTCGVCAPGQWFSRIFFECRNCTDDNFRAEPGIQPCLPCPAGTVASVDHAQCVTARSTSNEEDGPIECEPGYFRDVASMRCQPCFANTASVGGQSVGHTCRPCARFSYAFPGSATCIECGENEGLLRSTGACGSCPSGSGYNERLHRCESCAINTFSYGGIQECYDCPANTFAPPGADTCMACPFGRFLMADGLRCDYCPPDKPKYFRGRCRSF